jgi:glycerol kinase
MLYNTGTKPVFSDNGLLTTVGFRLSPTSPTIYALEGSIASAGSAVNWWKNNLRLIEDAKEVDGLVETTQNNGGCYFVPAFGGLFAPYWREDARGTVLGLTQFTTRGHVLRATLEAICFQTRAVS